jgi:flagellar biogenesis protein FliO
MVFAIFYIIILCLKLFIGKRGLAGNKKYLHLLDVMHPGPNLSLYLLESRGKTILIASNANHITSLQETDITEDETINNINENSIPGEHAFRKIVDKLFQKGDGNNEKI